MFSLLSEIVFLPHIIISRKFSYNMIYILLVFFSFFSLAQLQAQQGPQQHNNQNSGAEKKSPRTGPRIRTFSAPARQEPAAETVQTIEADVLRLEQLVQSASQNPSLQSDGTLTKYQQALATRRNDLQRARQGQN